MTDQRHDETPLEVDARLRRLLAADSAAVARITRKALAPPRQRARHVTPWRLAAATAIVAVIAVVGIAVLRSSPPVRPDVVTICSVGDVVIAIPEKGTPWITNTSDEKHAAEPTVVIVKGER